MTHGMRSANTNFLDYPNNGALNQFDYGFAGRIEYKAMGRWKDYFSRRRRYERTVAGVWRRRRLLGARARRPGGRGGRCHVRQPEGLSLYGEFVDRYTTHNFGYYIQSATGAMIIAGDPAVAGKPSNEYSIVAQAGYIIGGHLEPFGRYEFIHLQGTPAGSHNWVQAVAGGRELLFPRPPHEVDRRSRLWLPNGLPFDDTSNDVLTTSGGKPEISFIAQLQFLL